MDVINDIKTNPNAPLSKVLRNYLKFTFEYLVACGKVLITENNYATYHSDIYSISFQRDVWKHEKKKKCILLCSFIHSLDMNAGPFITKSLYRLHFIR
jgi:hypothetical protein